MNNRKKYGVLFWSTFQLSACTFGGGFVIVPLMRKKFVSELGWIGEEEMMDLIAIAQSSPGAIAVNAAVMLGYRVAGVLGALICVAGTVLPPMGIISAVSVFYAQFRESPLVDAAMSGMLVGVAAVITDVVITMICGVCKQRRILPVAVMLAAFAAVHMLHISMIAVIPACGVIGACDTLCRARRRGVGK